jgi:hypothetical protein
MFPALLKGILCVHDFTHWIRWTSASTAAGGPGDDQAVSGVVGNDPNRGCRDPGESVRQLARA